MHKPGIGDQLGFAKLDRFQRLHAAQNLRAAVCYLRQARFQLQLGNVTS